MYDASTETGNDLSLDFNKETKSNSINNSNDFIPPNNSEIKKSFKQNEKMNSSVINKNEKPKFTQKEFLPKERINKELSNNNSNNKETSLKNFNSNLQIHNFDINMKNNRFGCFQNLRTEQESNNININNSPKNNLIENKEKIKKNKNNDEKNNKVINQINSLLIDMNNTSNTKTSAFSPEVKNSLISTYKDFLTACGNIKKNQDNSLSLNKTNKASLYKNDNIIQVNFNINLIFVYKFF